ncbi:MAG: exopolysaccharide biosynthesis polyprenyl glycosylphosphotransferase [Erythrobacter sp.]|uniref:exopolysaccharide biosynthesis polyprenyl glycosylphosphotransferase n=1 Tax=Erythrobacter sp. TaxID=1042 RepID=UPI0032EBE4D6
MMQSQSQNLTIPTSRRIFGRSDVQLLLLLFAGLMPLVVVWTGIRNLPLENALILNTLYALALAITAGWYVISRLRSYAKTQQLTYVFPINFLMFSTVLAVIAILRADYSAVLYFWGAVSATTASFVLNVINRGTRSLHFVIPGGRTDEIALYGNFIAAPELVELRSLLEAKRIDGAIVADLHHDHPDEWERLFAQAALKGIPVYHHRQIAEMQSGQVKISHLSENDLGSLIPNAPYIPIKRLVDILAAVALLPVCLVLFPIIALAIRLDSPGRVFFVQERVGFRGQPFRMFKFRTMLDLKAVPDCERESAMTKADDDRITRIGRFLRKTRIDELPQIFNVLRGDMSLIGPRPEAMALSEWYEGELPFYSYRHIVRPGITGWAQVNQGHVTDVSDILSKLRYDFYYIKNISLWLDLLIVLKTLRVVLTGSGAK